jgi:exonuclease SbcC
VEELRTELREGLARLDQQRQASEQRAAQLRLALAELEARLAAAREQQGELERAWAEAREALDEGLRREGLDRGQLGIWASRDDGWIQRVRIQLSELRDAVTRTQSLWELRRKEEQEHLALPMAGTGPDAEARRQEVEAQQRALLDQLAARRADRERDEQARARAQALELALELARQEAEPWRVVGGLIGSADGKKFRTFSQSLTLEALLVQANHHLSELSPRYVLQRVPEQDLELQVVDRDMGEEVRSIHSLSGGETFLVSLSLALGLSSLSARNTRVDTLFIDEGFGTLDGQTLEVVLHALDQLQHSGRQIGLISHVAGLAERIGVGVKVEPRGGGRSVVKVA